MSRSWPKFGDNDRKYRELKNGDETSAEEIVESLPAKKSQPKLKHVKIVGKPSSLK